MNTNKIALITGANKGIGLETARQLARDHGFTVLLGARDEKRGQDAAKQLQSEELDAQFLLIDPTDVAAVERTRAQVEEQFGRLDVLINNACMLVQDDLAPPATVPTAVLRDTYDLNVFGVHQVTRTFWPLLEKFDAARLVNVSSMIGSLAANADFAGPMKDYKFIAYSSSKARSICSPSTTPRSGKTHRTAPTRFIPAASQLTPIPMAKFRSKKARALRSQWPPFQATGQTALSPIWAKRCPGEPQQF